MTLFCAKCTSMLHTEDSENEAQITRVSVQ